MSNQPVPKTTFASRRGSKTPLSVISKYYNKASLKVDNPPASGHYHGRCCKRHSADKLVPVNPKPIAGIVKNPVEPKPQEPHVPTDPSCQTLDSTSPQATQPEKSIQQLSPKFDQLSDSILDLAISEGSVGVRSLESLLTKDFQDFLGSEVNDPKNTQGFFQSTRGLIEKLVHVYEEGRINPRLIKGQSLGPSRHKFLTASSATSVCYKDRYFKELVMNVLQSMSSNDVEDELPPPPSLDLLSAASRERIRAIRDMVRVEAGLQPELFQQLDQKLEDLRRSLSQNRLEMLRATKEVERVISIHLMKRSSSDCVEIPEAAKTALKRNYKKCDKSSCDKGCGRKDGSRIKPTVSSPSKNGLGLTKNFLTSLGTFGLDLSDDYDVLKCKAPDPFHEIRSKMTELVEEEILRMKEKSQSILDREMVPGEISAGEDLPASSAESWGSRSDTICSEEDGTEDEDMRTVVEHLKSNLIEENVFEKNISCSVLSSPILEKIDEGEMDFITEELDIYPTLLKSNTEPNRHSITNDEVIDRDDSGVDLEDSLTGTPGCNLGSECQISTEITYPQYNRMKKCSIEDRFKSKWWSTDDSIASIILKEMKQAFDTFGMQAVKTEEYGGAKTDQFVSEEKQEDERGSELNQNEFDFTVEQMANAIDKVVTRTKELIRFSKETGPKFSQRKFFAYDVLKVLENSVNNLDVFDYRNMDIILNEEDNISQTADRICSDFSYLADSLNRAPSHLKTQPLSILSPPPSMLRTLATLASTEYFRDCFISVIAENSWNSRYELPTPMPNVGSLAPSKIIRDGDLVDHGHDVEIVKAYTINEQKSSVTMPNMVPKLSVGSHSTIIRSEFRVKPEKPEDVPKNLANFEHYLGLSASVMTVQNVSDMFLYLSTVLNDVPYRVKGKKILSLNPPFTLRAALDILYAEDDPTGVEKKVSFASLTVQNVADFFLTLSKTFDNTPQRVKNSIVLDLQPPKSLLKAIHLLTSLPYNSILDSNSQDDILEEEKSASQDQFYDAVDTFTLTCK